MNHDVLAVVIAAIIGLGVGLLIMWLLLGNSRRKQQQYQCVKSQFQTYRQQVDQHFADTALAMQDFSHCYHKMIEQWNKSAKQLLDNPVTQQAAQITEQAPTATHLDKSEPHVHAIKDIPLSSDTDATEAEVVPIHGQPDQVPDRIGAHAATAAEPVAPKSVTADQVK